MPGLSVYDGILNPGGGLVTPQSQVDEMYRGIYPSQPSNVSRVTPEGLNVNKVQIVAIDPFTGNPVTAGGTTAPHTAAVLSKDPGRLTAGSATQLPPANYGAADMAYAPSSSVVARSINPDGTYSDPLTAIDHATAPKPTGGAWGGGWGADGVGRFLAGDPGQTDWSKISADNGLNGIPAQGFATLPNGKPTVRSVIAARKHPSFNGADGRVYDYAGPDPNLPGGGNVYRAHVVSPQVQAALMAQQTDPAGSGDSGYLRAQGVDTSRMTAGEIANAFMKSIT